MPENILVVEYEPRYTDRVRSALAGQPLVPSFAKDGEEAIRALDQPPPRLIVVSSVVPKISTSDLIHAIRERTSLQDTPILLTVSGYTGKSPKQDALRLGASDILPKPYSESEFLGKVQQMLGIRAEGAQLTSNEIFGDLLEEEKEPSTGVRKPMRSTDDVDKMLADTLAGVMPQRKKEPTQAPAAPAAKREAKPKTQSGTADLDKLLQDTLSGLEKTLRKSGALPASAAAKPPEPPVSYATEKFPTLTPDRVHWAEPILTKPEPVREAEEEPTDGVRFGQYVLLEKIATGGMAEVWKARSRGVEGFQKIVAIKKILPHLSDDQDFIEMFIDEAKLAAQLNHNNIIHIYDLGKIHSSYYIAMEYVEGWDLKTILKRAQERDHPMSVELALFAASKIAAALDYAHRKRDFQDREMGLVHRDVSPQNVLISEEGDIKLCDFGIAKAASKVSQTQAGALKGKLQYMSPEQAWGKAIDKRSDVFALAAVLFEMLTGRRLFTGDNDLSILEQVREARVTPPSELNEEVTPEIDRIVMKALQKDPANRYQTAGEMARDIDQILYSFKPTPTSADLAIYMHRLSSPEPLPFVEPEPVIEPTPEPAPVAVPAPAVTPSAAAPAMPAWEEPAAAAAEPSARKLPVVPIAIAAVVVIAIGVGVMLMRGKSSAPSTPSPSAAASTASPAAGSVPAPTTTAGAQPAATNTAVAPAQPVAIDQAKVAEEVQKRLAAERAKLEEQTRAQQQAPAVATRPSAPAPASVQAATQTNAPAATETRAAQAAPQPVAESRPSPPPPAQPAAETPGVHEGDLVSAEAEGVKAARMTRRASVPYPPIARMQHVEGTVILNVLVSETGQVLDVKIIRGINRPVGLNEAAEQTIRRSSFSPGTKDGVRVKMWVPVELVFKL